MEHDHTQADSLISSPVPIIPILSVKTMRFPNLTWLLFTLTLYPVHATKFTQLTALPDEFCLFSKLCQVDLERPFVSSMLDWYASVGFYTKMGYECVNGSCTKLILHGVIVSHL